MAKTDRAAFTGILRTAEDEMTSMFGQLATDIGQVVLQAAGPDGKVPEERIPELQRRIRPMVDRLFVGGPEHRPFDDEHRPLAPYPEIISKGQMAMIDLALGRGEKILDRHLPEDVRDRLAERYHEQR